MAKIKLYLEEAYNELIHKVTWPSWNELQTSAIIVMVASLIIALIVFVMDYVLGINSINDPNVVWKGLLGFIYNMVS